MIADTSIATAVIEFATAIKHGDPVHQAWLAEAAECFVAGKPLPAPRSKPPVAGTAIDEKALEAASYVYEDAPRGERLRSAITAYLAALPPVDGEAGEVVTELNNRATDEGVTEEEHFLWTRAAALIERLSRPAADGEAGEVVKELRKGMFFSKNTDALMGRAADLIEQQAWERRIFADRIDQMAAKLAKQSSRIQELLEANTALVLKNRETIEQCAAIADRWFIHTHCTGIARDIRALKEKA